LPWSTVDLENMNDVIYKKVAWFLLNYLKIYKNIESITAFELINEIEKLRNENINNPIIRKWLSFLLSVYPTKYFISLAFFNKNDRYTEFRHKKINIDTILQKIDPIYSKKIEDLSWDNLNQVGLNCNTPILNSGIEWCLQPYLKNPKDCPEDSFFSGFYYDKPEALEYGIYRTPEELEKLVKLIDNKKEMPIYKNDILKLSETEYRYKYMKYKEKYMKLKNIKNL
jgi:hypothetical protein